MASAKSWCSGRLFPGFPPSQWGPPEVSALLKSVKAVGWLLVGGGVLPLPSRWEARESLPAEKKEEQMSGQTWPRVNKAGT